MLGGSFFREFEEDPFFVGRQHMQQMQQMQQLMIPFHPMQTNMLQQGQVQGRGHTHTHSHNHGHRQRDVARRRHRDVVPFGMFGADFGFGTMFSNMRRMMDDMHRSFGQVQVPGQVPGQVQLSPPGPNTHTFTQSSYVSYSNNGQGQPQVYQATSSTRQAPGGVKETRRTERDTGSGVEKMAIGHHINERAHIIERSHNRNTGDQNENQEYINIDEEEAPTFDREWQEKTRHLARGMDIHRVRHNPIGNGRNGRHMAALPEPKSRNRSHRDRE